MHGVEQAIARIASRQDNVIDRDQLLEAGLGRGRIARWVSGGRMRRLYRSVYLFGPAPPTPMARARAAVRACGPGAVLSHRSAAALWRIHVGERGRVEITVVRALRTRSTLAIRQGPLPADEVTTRHGIPVTTPARTLLDLAAVVAPERLERARPRRRSSASRARSRSPIS